MSQNAYSPTFIAVFPYLGRITQTQPAQQPSGLQAIPGEPTTDAQGTEFDGRGVANAGGDNPGTIVAPNGTSGTPAALETAAGVIVAAGINPAGAQPDIF